jgi:DnaJ-class molecular chaperone
LDFAVPYQRVLRCDQCSGSGLCIPEAQRCWQCLGVGHLAEPSVVTVPLDEVKKISDLVVLEQQGDCGVLPGEAPGNLEFQLELLSHPSWALVGDYFYCEKRIPIIEALTGGAWELLACDDATRLLCCSRQVIRDGALLLNEEHKLMVRVRYAYPEELLSVWPGGLGPPLAAEPVLFIAAGEHENNYFDRNWGNRRTVLTVIE